MSEELREVRMKGAGSNPLEEVQSRFALNNRDFASLCCVTERTVERWRGGQRQVPGAVLAFLSLIVFLMERHPETLKAYHKAIQVENEHSRL